MDVLQLGSIFVQSPGFPVLGTFEKNDIPPDKTFSRLCPFDNPPFKGKSVNTQSARQVKKSDQMCPNIKSRRAPAQTRRTLVVKAKSQTLSLLRLQLNAAFRLYPTNQFLQIKRRRRRIWGLMQIPC